jgi:tRNA pseudouridine32 synthase/23S rRNA pseudouridine746 synthase
MSPSDPSQWHHSLQDLSQIQGAESDLPLGQPDYFYQGYCAHHRQHYRLPRTPLAKAVARHLMRQLAADPAYCQQGKMYGVLLLRTKEGQTVYLKAFSGLLQGAPVRPGWVPPIPGRGRIALQEAETLQALEAIKQRLKILQQLPERQQYEALLADVDRQRHHLNQHHRRRKQDRDGQRQKLLKTLQGSALQDAVETLAQESRRDKAELRAFKQAKTEHLAPLISTIQAADEEMLKLKRERKSLSRQLQAEMHQVYCLTNFAGQSLPVEALGGNRGLPTGTGDCCAPKLLHFAAEHGLEPLAMAEFWWGPDAADKRQGEFYGACAERCQPIMGFMLAGLSAAPTEAVSTPDLSLQILYEDDELVAVNKPAGLLSVPGRYGHRQDSALSRLKLVLPDGEQLVAVHRLDQDTSGVLMLARHRAAEQRLRQQFQVRQVGKTYEALVHGHPAHAEGIIDLPLWGNPEDRPRQTVHWQWGKSSQTRYRVLAGEGETTRVEFSPVTGRTHQLRVHAAHPQGLNAPIVGDRLYGNSSTGQRLHLHARELRLQHPDQDRELVIQAPMPF